MDESTFRMVALILLLAFGLVWGVNLLRVGISKDVFYSKRESLSMALFSRGVIAACIVGLVAYVDEPETMAWSQVDLPVWLRLLGAPVAAVGVVLLWWVLSTLGRNFSMSLAIKRGQTLVTDGPYRWVRHPLYTAFLAAFTGLALVCANWFVGLAAGLGFGAAMLIRTPDEERMLVEEFGDEYRAYMARTGRFLPTAGLLTRR